MRRNIAENFNRLSMVHKRYRQTDRRVYILLFNCCLNVHAKMHALLKYQKSRKGFFMFTLYIVQEQPGNNFLHSFFIGVLFPGPTSEKERKQCYY